MHRCVLTVRCGSFVERMKKQAIRHHFGKILEKCSWIVSKRLIWKVMLAYLIGNVFPFRSIDEQQRSVISPFLVNGFQIHTICFNAWNMHNTWSFIIVLSRLWIFYTKCISSHEMSSIHLHKEEQCKFSVFSVIVWSWYYPKLRVNDFYLKASPSPLVTPIIIGTLLNFPCSNKILGFSVKIGSWAVSGSMEGEKTSSWCVNGDLSWKLTNTNFRINFRGIIIQNITRNKSTIKSTIGWVNSLGLSCCRHATISSMSLFGQPTFFPYSFAWRIGLLFSDQGAAIDPDNGFTGKWENLVKKLTMFTREKFGQFFVMKPDWIIALLNKSLLDREIMWLWTCNSLNHTNALLIW